MADFNTLVMSALICKNECNYQLFERSLKSYKNTVLRHVPIF